MNWFWPDIHNLDTARDAALTGSHTAFVVSGMTGALALLSAFHILNLADPWSLVDAMLFAVLGLLMRRMSRVAATSAIALFTIERGYEAFVRSRRPMTTVAAVLVGVLYLGFTSGVRGTIAYHRYKREST
jgi:hypothetical protein